MKDIISEILKLFSHLAREIQVYCITGFIVIINIVYILKYCFGYSNGFQFNQYTFSMAIILSYVIGHICMAFYTLLLESFWLDKIFYKIMFFCRFKNNKVSDEELVADKSFIIATNERLYIHFIERNVNLAIMRWNYSAAFSINSILNFIIYYKFEKNPILYDLGIAYSFLAFILMLLHVFTQKENGDQIKKIKENLEKT